MKYEIGMKGSFAKKVTDELVRAFAEISGDVNPIHLDDEKAKESVFKKRVAHGMIGASFISATLGNIMPGFGTIYLGQELRFVKPVFIDDVLTTEVEIKSISEKNIAKIDTVVLNQNDEIVICGEATVRLPK